MRFGRYSSNNKRLTPTVTKRASILSFDISSVCAQDLSGILSLEYDLRFVFNTSQKYVDPYLCKAYDAQVTADLTLVCD